MKSRVVTTLSAVSICSRLEGLIRSGVQIGVIGAALSQAIYIHAGNFLITIASQEVGNLPYGILLPRGTMQLLGEFKPGDNVEFSPERLWFPRLAITIGFSNADFWVPHLFIRNRIGSLDTFVTNLCVLRKELLAISNADQGLVRIAQLTEPITGIVDGAYILNLYCRKVLPVLKNIASQWKLGRLRQVIVEAHKLLGFGPGFTPSGDDFVLGLMTALWIGSNVFPRFSRKFDGIISQLGDFERDRTTEVSQAFLKEASVGRFPERLNELAESIVYSGPEDTAFCSQRLSELGATSGSDIGAGVLFGGYLVIDELIFRSTGK